MTNVTYFQNCLLDLVLQLLTKKLNSLNGDLDLASGLIDIISLTT